MSEQIINHSSVPFEIQHDSELQVTAPVTYIPLGSPAVRHLLPEKNLPSRQNAVTGAKATQDAIAMRERIETLGVDSLTGLPTRRIFDENLPRIVQRAKGNIEQGKRTKTAITIIDVNNLKGANDLDQDHSIGDRYLVTTTEGLAATRRATDFAARIGGDEFVEIIQDVEPDVLEDGTLDYDSPLKRLIQNKKSKVEQSLKGADIPDEIDAGVTIGYAFIEQDDTEETVLKRADKDMYSHKPQVLAENEMLEIESDSDYVKERNANNLRGKFEDWYEKGLVEVRKIARREKGSPVLSIAKDSEDVSEYFRMFEDNYPALYGVLKRLIMTDARLSKDMYNPDVSKAKAAQEKRNKWQVEHGEEMHRMLKAALHVLTKSAEGKHTADEFIT